MAKSSTSFKPGQIANPKGAPKRGHSWAELFDKFGAMTAKQLREAAKAPGTSIKELAVINILFALASGDVNARLVSAVMDRQDGKPAQPITGAGEGGEHIYRFIDATEKKEGQ